MGCYITGIVDSLVILAVVSIISGGIGYIVAGVLAFGVSVLSSRCHQHDYEATLDA